MLRCFAYGMRGECAEACRAQLWHSLDVSLAFPQLRQAFLTLPRGFLSSSPPAPQMRTLMAEFLKLAGEGSQGGPAAAASAAADALRGLALGDQALPRTGSTVSTGSSAGAAGAAAAALAGPPEQRAIREDARAAEERRRWVVVVGWRQCCRGGASAARVCAGCILAPPAGAAGRGSAPSSTSKWLTRCTRAPPPPCPQARAGGA